MKEKGKKMTEGTPITRPSGSEKDIPEKIRRILQWLDFILKYVNIALFVLIIVALAKFLNWNEFPNHIKKAIIGYSSEALPVGTIIPTIFKKVPGNLSELFCPCDGRPAPTDSLFSRDIASFVPDLRGVFLRGLNKFDDLKGSRNDGMEDPDGDRVSGSSQQDVFKTHVHKVEGFGGDFGPHIGTAHVSSDNVRTTGPEDSGGGRETRPKNVAVYYYIKVR
ncbi:MAG: hypothetical protein HQM08_29340 [Candidatus Riflebacteria bacterium]|nr:hypothetical protein [Candidatus Riflebacteria bacterium]